jgi:hypothetical protein
MEVLGFLTEPIEGRGKSGETAQGNSEEVVLSGGCYTSTEQTRSLFTAVLLLLGAG